MKQVMRGLDQFNRTMTTGARLVANICVAIQIVIVFCGTVWRYWLNSPISWVDELATLLLVVISFLGCYLAMAKHKLARIEVVLNRFKGKARAVAYVISECITLLMLLFVICYGTQLFLSPTSLGQRTAGLYIPLCIFYGMIPFTFILNVVLSVTDILHYLLDPPEVVEKEIDGREGFSV